MKQLLHPLITLFVVLCAVPAIAQEPPAREMMLGKRIFYALGPEIRAEIKLTPAQTQKIIDCFEGALQVDGDRIMVTMHGGEDMSGMEKAAMKVLDAAQTKRLTECWIQVLGGIAVADDEIAKQLKLTEKQRKDVERALEVGADEMQAVFSSGAHDESTQKAAKAVQVATGKKVEKILTEEQRLAFEKMKGEPMKKKEKKDGGSGGEGVATLHPFISFSPSLRRAAPSPGSLRSPTSPSRGEVNHTLTHPPSSSFTLIILTHPQASPCIPIAGLGNTGWKPVLRHSPSLTLTHPQASPHLGGIFTGSGGWMGRLAGFFLSWAISSAIARSS